MIYLLAFCRVAIGLVFAISSIGKIRDIARFQQTIWEFRVLSRGVSNLAALLFLGGEMAVVLLLLLGGAFLLPGFVLAILLLLLFCGALASVLGRNLSLSCNCFGASQKPVTVMDIWRNLGFLLSAVGGCALLVWTQGRQESLGGVEWLLIGFGAAAFVLIWIQVEEIAHLFH